MEAATSTPATPPAADSAPEPCAILYLPKVKGRGKMRVSGATGRYEFVWHASLERMARFYFSAEQFKREEEDLRAVEQDTAICTLLGSVDLERNAQEAVQKLIAARQRVRIDRRRETLTQIRAVIDAALAQIEINMGAPAETQTPEATEPEARLLPEAVQIPENQWKDSGTNLPLDVTSESAPRPTPIDGPLVTKPADTSPAKRWEQAELMQLPWNDFKAMATRDGVAVGKLGKEKLAEAYLAAQAAGFPNRGTQA